MRRALPFLIVSVLLLVPVAASAQVLGPLVPCGNDVNKNGVLDASEQCQACHAVELAQNIINFLVYIASFLAVLIFSWAGFLYVTAAGDTGKIGRAHAMFTDVALGFVIVLAGWLVIDTVMKYLFQNLNEGEKGSELYEETKTSFGPWNQINCVKPPPVYESVPGGTSVGNGSTPPPGASCTDCATLGSNLQVSPRACSGTAPCQVSTTLAPRLNGLAADLTAQGIDTSQWRVTEAWPPTVTHQNACHNAGTCVDANFSGTQASPDRISAFISAADKNNLRAVYEVKTAAERDSLVSSGVPASNIQVVTRITGPHFSVYSR